jgi:hypothetical protein
MAMRRMTATMRVLGVVNSTVVREFDNDGAFKKATFHLSDGQYSVSSDFSVRKLDSNNNLTELKYQPAKGGIYKEITICGMRVKSHALIKVLTEEDAFDKYMCGLEINHTVITKMASKPLRIGKDIGFGNGEITWVNTKPLDAVSTNPDYLEFVSRSENIRHGKFIKEYSLYDTYVSAKDIDELRKLLVPYNTVFADMQDQWVCWNRTKVEKFYRSKGVEQQVLF